MCLFGRQHDYHFTDREIDVKIGCDRELAATMHVDTLTGESPDSVNSFEEPLRVAPCEKIIEVSDNTLSICPYSVNIFRAKLMA